MTRLGLVLLPLVLFGCDGGEDTPTPTPTPPTPPPTDTADGTGGGGGFVPAAFAAALGEFAIDENGDAVAFSTTDAGGNVIQGQVAISVLLLDASVTATTPINDSNSCSVVFGVPGPVSPAQWATDAGIYWGFTLPAGTPAIGDTCQNFDFPAEWGGDVAAVLSQWDWGVGLNVMDPAVEAQLPGAFGAQWTVLEPAVIGAGWYSNILEGSGQEPYVDGGFAYAQEVDATFAAQFDGAGAPILLDSTDVWFAGANQPAMGAYAAQGIFFIQGAEALVGTP